MIGAAAASTPRNQVIRRFLALDTVVCFRLEGVDSDDPALASDLDQALRWIADVESACSRFDPSSEVSRLAQRTSEWIQVSPLLAGALDIALRLAAITDGAFDPAIGGALALRGPSRHYITGETWSPRDTCDASFHDIELDLERTRVRLRRPALLDLGAVAKGLAVDLAARALQQHGARVIDAGGDIYLAGRHDGSPWRVGIAGGPDRLLGTFTPLRDVAVCTSGPWFRPAFDGGHHLLDARAMRSATAARSATAIASSAMVADGAATAAFILGPDDGLALLRELELDGLVQAPDGHVAATSSWLEP
jgi:FAD:protein FMN transferase